ncbi:hypothetical protein ACIQ1H_15510 [Lysinibacillus sp. NPDC097279]|uniref:hypothetical protein n=1 Tax=unclassified Lysinibacillus TaxID=2636778 RepID=UPI001168C099|nr:hypothetical protein [Lysinibacillus sp. CD3-6]QPQ37357.1 hypothetical protein JNUCC52_10775 [Lysinibacillus sp. JNUCC-52]UED80847.1 hypothetical protein FH508_0002835 [Lysinibacillus sp. CD3-6]
MWKMSFLTIILATVFLGGCNWGNNAANETPMEDVKNDVREGVNDVEDVVDPNRNHDVYDRDVNNNTRGTVNDGTVNDGTVNESTVMPEATTPGSNADVNGSNGYDNVPNANGVDRNNNTVNERNTMTTP